MRTDVFINLMEQYGDACVNYKSAISKRMKYVVGTTDFTCDYIKDKLDRLKQIQTQKNGVLLFCWDSDSFKTIDTSTVVSVVPLSKMLGNV